MAAERKVLERCAGGDRILLGFAKHNYEPAVEHIKKMVGGGTRNLELLFARRVDGTVSGTVYDYATEEATPVKGLRGDGNFILLKYMSPRGCTSAAPPSPAELLGPAFDLGESLPGEGLRIFYNMNNRPAGEWFEVAEARLNADTKYMYGTYYLDCVKLRDTMEAWSRPFGSGGVNVVRNAVMEEAYYIHERNRAASADDNWGLAQRKLVARIISYLNWMRGTPQACADHRGVRLSRTLETEGLGVRTAGDSHDCASLAPWILYGLKIWEEHLHMAPAIVPYGPYINGLLATVR